MDGRFVALFTISQLLLLMGLVVKPSPYRWMLWPPIACINCYCYFYTPTNDGPNDEGLRRCVSIIYAFVASDFILLTDVQRELRLVGQHEPISNSRFWSRLKWGVKLFFGARGLCWLAGCVLINDAFSILMRADPFLVKHAPPFAEQPLRWRCWGVVLFAVSSTVNVSIIHITSSIVIVGAGLSEPSMWPPFFGKWVDAYSVRKFWGQTWHKLLRRTLSSHGKYLAHRVFHLASGSTLSYLVELYTAFFISGLAHVIPTDARPLRFFLSQAVAITFEEAVFMLAARSGLRIAKRFQRFLGYLWVYCWFVYSIGPLMDTMGATGVSDYGGMKFSLILGLYRGEWVHGS